jgi:hypothetical protein
MLPKFPTFVEAREMLLREESAKEAEQKQNKEAALIAAGSPPMGADSTAANTNAMDHTPANNNNQGRGGFGRGGGRNRGRRGGRNGGRNNNGGRGTGFGWQGFPQWAMLWGTPWRAPWTGATGPGVLGSHPPAMGGQAYPAFQQPMTTAAPLQASSWDTTGLLQALHATSM